MLVKRIIIVVFIYFCSFALYAQSDSDGRDCSKVKEIINYSKTKLGIKYVWGATGPDSYDCSGFTQEVFRHINIILPRTAKEQFKFSGGQRVELRKIKQGDLIFFVSQDLDPSRLIGHVGMAISDCINGSFQFIHASSSVGEICIKDFNEALYKDSFAGARRFVQCPGSNDADTLGIDQSGISKINDFPDEYFMHDVKVGETLLSISLKYIIDEEKIMLWNDLKTESLDGIKQLKIYFSIF